MTCSKDSRVLFWSILGSKHEVKLKATVDMKKEQVVYNIIIFHLKVDMIFSQNWIHTWGGRFNKTDTLLLVAGVLDQVTSPPIFKLPICMYIIRLPGWSLCWTQATTQYSGLSRTARTMLWELGCREVQMLIKMMKLGSRVKHLCFFFLFQTQLLDFRRYDRLRL